MLGIAADERANFGRALLRRRPLREQVECSFRLAPREGFWKRRRPPAATFVCNLAQNR